MLSLDLFVISFTKVKTSDINPGFFHAWQIEYILT